MNIDWKHDLPASIVVFLVALPLCMGIALASGVPVAAGLITGMVGGLVVGFLAGSPLQVSGPAAGLTVIVYEIVAEHGFPVLGTIVLLAGLMQVVAGLLRFGQWFRAVSPAVIKGMLAGIGVLIIASQVHVMVDDKPRESSLQNLLTIPEAVAKGLPMPEWRSQEEREFRTRHLKQFGHLHELQEEVQEDIAEHVASEMTPEEVEYERELVARLEAKQERITTELEKRVEELREFGLTERDEDLAEASQVAVAASRNALTEMRERDLARVLPSQERAEEAVEALLGELKNHDWAAKVGLAAILIIFCGQFVPKKLRVVPAPLVAVVLVTAAAAALSLPVLYVEVPDDMRTAIHLPTLTVLRDIPVQELLLSAMVIAVIASAETLLCATAVDQLHGGPRTKYDRELWAQGVGNTICGVLGALPMTGVIVRSSANVHSGARTRWSAILHGLWLLTFVVALGWMLTMIPTACLAGMLVHVGIKLVDISAIRRLAEFGWGEVVIYFATVITIVTTDLLTGVVTGVILSAVKLLYRFSHLEVDVDVDEENQQATMSLRGAATFVRLPVIASELEKVPAGTELHVDFDRLDYIDHACLELLAQWARQHEATGGSMAIDWEKLHAQFRKNNGDQKAPGEQNAA